MSIFEEALARARGAIDEVYARSMTITPIRGGAYKGASPDPARPSFDIVGVLHEFASERHGEEASVERSDGGRPGGRFGIDLAAGTTRISFDLGTLAGRSPIAGDRIAVGGRIFEVSHPAPPNGGRQAFFVSEIVP